MRQKVEIDILARYYDLIETDKDIVFMYGGRDSGKSHFITQQMVLKAMQPDYFRCILVKKTYESIKDAQWQSIKDFVYDVGLDPFFKFTQSPLEIECLTTGNKFIARGCDKPEKLKSISNPSHAWFEEGNQLTQEDYETITTTLRSNKARVQEWFSFNPESKGDYKDFWLYKQFFAGHKRKSFDAVIELPIGNEGETVEINYTAIHTTYKDNPYCSNERKARHENLKKTNPYRYGVFTLGEWGNEENDSPFFYSFDLNKHYRDSMYHIDPRFEVVLSFDFNADPCTCVVGQWNRGERTYNVIATHYASPTDHKGALEKLCAEIESMYVTSGKINRNLLTVTGDAAGKHSDADRAKMVNRYTSIQGYLKIGRGAIKVERHNIKHSASRDLCNDVLNQIPEGFFVFWNGTEKLIENIQASYPDDNDSLNKAKKELGLHDVDAFRYLMKYWFAHGLHGTRFNEYQKTIDGFVRSLKMVA